VTRSSSLKNLESTQDRNFINLICNFQACFLAIMGKRDLVKFVVEKNKEVFERNKKLSATLEIFNEATNEITNVYKEKINLINSELFDNNLSLKLYENYDKFKIGNDESYKEFIALTNDIKARENILSQIETDELPSEKAEQSLNEIRKILFKQSFEIFSNDFNSILHSHEKDEVIKEKMKE
jgi:hypothetical protein